MKVYSKIAIIFCTILILVLGLSAFFNRRDGEYHISGTYSDDFNEIKVDAFLIQNKKGDFLIYNTNIYYANENIVASRMFYKVNDTMHVVLGNGLNSHDYSKKGENKREYGYDYIEEMFKNSDNLYFDLCTDNECNDIFTTIKLKFDTLN